MSSQRAPKSVFSEFYNADGYWSSVRVVDEEELSEVKELFSNLMGDIDSLKDRQPKCSVHPESYERDFSRFCVQVEHVFIANDALRERLSALAVLPEKFAELEATIGRLSCYVENNNWVYDLGYFSSVVEALIFLKESFTPEKLQLASGLQDMQKILEQNDAQLESMLEPTHHWVEDGPKSKYCDKCNKRSST